jgi:hypothetical protein
MIRALLEARPTPQEQRVAPVSPSALERNRSAGSAPQVGPLTTPHAATANIRRPSDSSPGTITRLRAFEEPPCPADPQGTAKALEEVREEGFLFPSLIIGLGQVGLQVLQQFRGALHNGLGSSDYAAHIRLLLLDTDPETVRQAMRSPKEGTENRIAPRDVLLAGLNRPSYYLKSRETLAALERWLKPRMLYRIPRSQVTTGVRALGRLAFCDNYRAIRARLKREIEALLDPKPLTMVARQTGLGVRTNRPRVYVVCALSGGTGGGMFLDVAYTVRALLRETGLEQPDLVGLFFLPPVDRSRTRVLGLGNTYAALTELRYYAWPATLFTSRYNESEPPVEETAPPFGRCVFLPLPEETDEPATEESMCLAGQYLFRDLCSPLGKAADEARGRRGESPAVASGLVCQTFGMFQVTWPRRKLFETVGRQLCRRLVERWISKDAKPVREAVQKWVDERWARNELGANVFLDRLRDECVQRFGQEPEAAFKEALQQIVDKYAPNAALPPRSLSKSAQGVALRPSSEMAPEDLIESLGRLDEILGTPAEDHAPEPRGSLVQLLRQAAKDLINVWGQKLAEVPVQLIEDPSFRLAGAEEAVRQLVAMIEQILQQHEPLSKELVKKSREACERLHAFAGVPVGRAGACHPDKNQSHAPRRGPLPPPADVVELLRAYAKWRFQSLVLTQLSSAFVTLRGHLADEMREINSCRVRLGALLSLFQDSADGAAQGTPATTARTPATPPAVRLPERAAGKSAAPGGRLIFPTGQEDLAGAAMKLLGQVGPEALQTLDTRIQAMLKHQFLALVHVCLCETNVLPQVRRAMLQTARLFAEGLVPPTDVADMVLEQNADQAQAIEEVSGFFEAAAPKLLRQPSAADGSPSSPVDLCVLVTPPGEGGERIRQLVERALIGIEVNTACGGPNPGDDIVVYRETSNLPLAGLQHLGPEAWDAYAQMSGSDQFTPHSRMDVDFLAGK